MKVLNPFPWNTLTTSRKMKACPQKKIDRKIIFQTFFVWFAGDAVSFCGSTSTNWLTPNKKDLWNFQEVSFCLNWNPCQGPRVVNIYGCKAASSNREGAAISQRLTWAEQWQVCQFCLIAKWRHGFGHVWRLPRPLLFSVQQKIGGFK